MYRLNEKFIAWANSINADKAKLLKRYLNGREDLIFGSGAETEEQLLDDAITLAYRMGPQGRKATAKVMKHFVEELKEKGAKLD